VRPPTRVQILMCARFVKKKSTWCVPFTRLTRPMVDMPSCTGLLKFFLKNVRGQFYPWAFHSVAWSFLTKIIDHMGFGPRWRIPVYNLLCVRSTCFLVNRQPEEEIRHQRGLHQAPIGCDWSNSSMHTSRFSLVVYQSLTKSPRNRILCFGLRR
jgi:hypothetical protein